MDQEMLKYFRSNKNGIGNHRDQSEEETTHVFYHGTVGKDITRQDLYTMTFSIHNRFSHEILYSTPDSR